MPQTAFDSKVRNATRNKARFGEIFVYLVEKVPRPLDKDLFSVG